MQNGNSSNSQQKPISLSELSFAELSKMRQEKAAARKKELPSEGEAKQQKEITPEEPDKAIEVAIELRDDIDINENFCKVPNARWEIAQLQDPKEYCVYDYLYRLSYGWHRNCCRVGYGAIVSNTSIPSRSSAIRAIEGLMEKVHIIRIDEEIHSKKGSLYRILSPDEILSGMFKTSIVNLSIVNLSISKTSIVNLNIVKSSTSYNQNDYTQNEYSEENPDIEGSRTIPKMNIVNLSTNKNNLKTDLKTTEEERNGTDSTMEKVLVVVSSSKFFKDLPQDTIKGLCKEYGSDEVLEKIHNLSEQYSGKQMDNPGGLLTDALKRNYSPPKSVVRKQKAAKVLKEKEREQMISDELRRQEEELRENLEAQKKKLDAKKRKALRDRALEEIRGTNGIKEDFISDALVSAKENEIIKSEMENDKSG